MASENWVDRVMPPENDTKKVLVVGTQLDEILERKQLLEENGFKVASCLFETKPANLSGHKYHLSLTAESLGNLEQIFKYQLESLKKREANGVICIAANDGHNLCKQFEAKLKEGAIPDFDAVVTSGYGGAKGFSASQVLATIHNTYGKCPSIVIYSRKDAMLLQRDQMRHSDFFNADRVLEAASVDKKPLLVDALNDLLTPQMGAGSPG